jgi:subtilisin family serine protease
VDTIKEMPGTFILKSRQEKDVSHIVNKLNKDKGILFAEVDLLTEAVDAAPFRIGAWGLPVQPQYLNQDVVTWLGLPQAHTITRGAGTVVAVLDTGVQLDHPALAASLVAGYDFVDEDADPQEQANGIDDNGDGRADEIFGHGTHVAGIVHLVAPEAKIMPVRVLDADGVGTLINLVKGIVFASQKGANVINISLGSTRASALLHIAVREAAQRGILVVASAGNLEREVEQFPAADDCAIGITSLDAREVRSEFSSFGKWVDFSAPGEAILSTFPVNTYAHWSGTSMATPFAAGQAALMRSVAPQFSVRDLVKVMQNTADDSIYKIKSNGKNKLGYGLINIGASVQVAATGYVDLSGKKKIKGGCIH